MHVAEARDPYLSFAALDALAAIGEPSIAPAVERLVRDPDLSESAATALAAVGDERSAAAIAAALRTGVLTPVTAARALAAIFMRLENTYGEGQLVADMVRPELSPEAVAQLAACIPQANDRDLIDIATVIGWLSFDGVDAALALADTIQRAAPNHLFGYLIRGEAADRVNDLAALNASYRAFLDNYDAQIRADHIEYREHKTALDDFRTRARATIEK